MKINLLKLLLMKNGEASEGKGGGGVCKCMMPGCVVSLNKI